MWVVAQAPAACTIMQPLALLLSWWGLVLLLQLLLLLLLLLLLVLSWPPTQTRVAAAWLLLPRHSHTTRPMNIMKPMICIMMPLAF
jgi:hypothetical protein